jgi:hypothetical protein
MMFSGGMAMDLRMGKGVQEVVVLRRQPGGRLRATTLYEKRKRRKKGTWGLNQVGKVVRTFAASQRAAAEAYLERHERSSRKKKDGWVRDLPYNVYRAARRGAKKLRAVALLPLPGDD